jgi:hypothetical protein
MTDNGQPSGKSWHYRFSRPGDVEIETGDFGGDDAAESRARELSTTLVVPVVVERHGVVDWQYVTEVDERP